MRKIVLAFFLSCFVGTVLAQVITTDIEFPKPDQPLTITFNANEGSKGLEDYSGDIYAHIGVVTSTSTSDSNWKHTVAAWAENTPKAKCKRISKNVYELAITPSIIDYFGVTDSETILKIGVVFRSEDTMKEGKNTGGKDIFIPVFNTALSLKINEPTKTVLLLEAGSKLTINATAAHAASSVIKIDGNELYTTNGATITYEHTIEASGSHSIEVIAYNADKSESVIKTIQYSIRQATVVEALPEGVMDGINYISDTEIVLVLHAPYKKNAFVIGNFNDWKLSVDYQMKRTSDDLITDDNLRYWIRISNLTTKQEYAFQYYVDEELYIADPYTEKILDPHNDQWIDPITYPDLKPYPQNKASGIVSILQTAQTDYQWQVANFEAPKKEDLVIYELHLRDFTEGPGGKEGSFKTAIARLDYLKNLGVNAVELMPVNEFEGNDSWGYNPSFMFAVDKIYGTKEDMKIFVDACHDRGMAVIIDIVMNHSFGQSPFVQLYLDEHQSAETVSLPESPWFNEISPNPTYKWGADFNHESEHTKKLLDRLNIYWLKEYNIDGFRFDFTKGFTNQPGEGHGYDESRIAILKRMYDQIVAETPHAFVILEHLADNNEEIKLANHGMLLWGNMNHSYNEATMGFNSNNKSDLSWGYAVERGWETPNLVTYMESHDEERLMYKNIEFGGINDSYSTRELSTALQRMELAANFFFTIPGPKMIWQFGELGYGHSINENGRVGKKPIHWEYLEQVRRKRLSAVYSTLAHLKVTDDVFENAQVTTSLEGAVKSIVLDGVATDVVVMGNFGTSEQKAYITFPTSGEWNELYTQETYTANAQQQTIKLQAGEYRFYTNVVLPKPNIPALPIPTAIASAPDLGITIYPNPTSDYVTITNAHAFSEATLYSQSGQLLVQESIEGGEQQLNLTHLPSGLFLLVIRNQSGKVALQRIIKQ